jgi:hypothetical protein
VQLPLVVANLGSSHTIHLHHAAQVQPQRDQSRVPEVHRCEISVTSAMAPKIGPLGLSPKKVGDEVTKATVIGRV